MSVEYPEVKVGQIRETNAGYKFRVLRIEQRDVGEMVVCEFFDPHFANSSPALGAKYAREKTILIEDVP